MTTTTIAKWVSADRKYWVELRKHVYHDGCTDSFSYRHANGNGTFVTIVHVAMSETAIRVMQARVNLGRFLLDSAVTPMERII